MGKKKVRDIDGRVRRSKVGKDEEDISIVRQCELLGISRSGYYYKPKQTNESTLKIMDEIDKIYTEFPFYGRRKMNRELKRRGYDSGERQTARLMGKMGLRAIYPKEKGLSMSNKDHIKYPYLLKGVDIERSNQVWATDITYVRVKGGFVYLTAYIDWFSRFITGWELSNTLTTDFCIDALEKGLSYGYPEMVNSDQGAQYTSHDYINTLSDYEIQISMDHKGRCFDNIIIERFWRNIKYEQIYIHEYETVRQAKALIEEYILKYNYHRLHESIDYQVPAERYFK